MARIKVSDLISRWVLEHAAPHAFLISGGGNMHLVESFGSTPGLSYVCCHHEQACAIAAESYSRATGHFGVCLVTTGPGATNALTGLTGAWLDSIPVLYLSGQVKRSDLGQLHGLRALGVQEANIIDMVKPVTMYAQLVLEPLSIRYHLDKALHMARRGRPGPVWLDLPLDVQGAMVEEADLERFDAEAEGLGKTANPELSSLCSQALALLKSAERPVIIGGHGIRLAGAAPLFLQAVELLRVPVLTAMSAHDLIESDHSLFAGRHGGFGDRAGNFAVQNADLILTIGARNHLWNIGYEYKLFGRAARKVVVDIDPAELHKHTLTPDLSICADAKAFLLELLSQAEKESPYDIGKWREQCRTWRRKYPVVTQQHRDQKDWVNSYYFTDVLSDLMSESEQIVLADGTAFTGTLQAIRVKKGQRLYCNVGCASMGWDLPAAVGVCFASGRKRVVAIAGDGSIMMNLQELQTIKHHGLPVKIFLLNNDGYLAIKNTQNSFFGGHHVASTPQSGVSFPDFKKVAEAFGVSYLSMRTNSDVRDVTTKALETEGPVLCEIFMDPNQTLYPKVTSAKKSDGTIISKPLEDMYPFLPREEFLRNMFISPVNEEID